MGVFFLAYQCCALFARGACGHLALLRLSKRNDFVKLTVPTEAGLPGCRTVSVLCTVQLNRIFDKHTATPDVCLFTFVYGAIILMFLR